MLLNCENFVPTVYRQSRDYKVFLQLWNIIINNVKYDIDNWLNLYDPLKCREDLLPLLADHIGYEYNYLRTLNQNRVIIKTFPELIKNRGSELGLRMAVALSLNSLIKDLSSMSENDIIQEMLNNLSQLSLLQVSYDFTQGIIKIEYPNTFSYLFEQNITDRLIDIVRPVGMRVEINEAKITTQGENLELSTELRLYNTPYDVTTHSTVDKTQIEFGQVGIPESEGD